MLAVLCSLAGVCDLVFLGAAGGLVAGVTRAGLGAVLLALLLGSAAQWRRHSSASSLVSEVL